jgi:hypothetical protein
MHAHPRGRSRLAPFLLPALLLLAPLCGGCGWFSSSGRGSPGQSFSLTDWFSAAPADSAKDARLRGLEIQKQALEAENRELANRLSASEAEKARAEKHLAAAAEELILAGRVQRPPASAGEGKDEGSRRR